MSKIKPQNVLSKVFVYIMVCAVAFIILYPMVYMVSMAIREADDMLDPAVIWIPKNFTTENFKLAFEALDYGKSVFRTAFLTLACSLLQCFSTALVGYGFARFKFKGNNLLFMIVLFTFMVPTQIISMPLFLTYRNFDFAGLGGLLERLTGTGFSFNFINTPIPMMASAFFGTGIRAGLFIYIFRQSFKNAPRELEEAASIDGCGSVATFFKIMIPNSLAILLVAFLFSLVWYWNDYFYSAIFYNQSRPLSVTLANLNIDFSDSSKGGTTIFTNDILVVKQAAALLYIAPILTLYLFLQKYFVESIERIGIVG